jgi:acyl-CoA thioesterase-1
MMSSLFFGKFIGRGLIFALLVCSASLAFGQAAISPAARAHTVLVLGDSLSAAHNLAEKEGWVALMAARLAASAPSKTGEPAWDVINAAISGETTSGGLSRLPELLAVHQPGWVLLELGANDGLRGLPLPIIRQNLQKLIDLSTQAGAKVVLLGIMLPPNYGPAYATPFAAMYQELARKNNLPLVPFLLDRVATNPALMQQDSLHPTAQGEPLVLDNVWAVVAPLWGSFPATASPSPPPNPPPQGWEGAKAPPPFRLGIKARPSRIGH